MDLEQCLSMLSGELAEDGAWSLEEAGATGAQRQRREWEQAEIREVGRGYLTQKGLRGLDFTERVMGEMSWNLLLSVCIIGWRETSVRVFQVRWDWLV